MGLSAYEKYSLTSDAAAGVLDLSTLSPADARGAGREPAEAHLAELRRMAAARCPPAAKLAGKGFDAVYINLEHRADRRSAMELSLERAGLQGSRRLQACTGADAPPWACATQWDCTLNARFDRNSVARLTPKPSAHCSAFGYGVGHLHGSGRRSVGTRCTTRGA